MDNFFWSDSSPDNYDSFVTRLDHNFTDRQRLFVRLSASRRPRLGDDDIFRTLATLRVDAPIGVDVDGLRWTGPRPDFAVWAARLGTSALHERAARLLATRVVAR